jgi:hypothetical protein
MPDGQILSVPNSPDLINSWTWGLKHPKSSHQYHEHILLDNTGLLPNPGGAVYYCQGEVPLVLHHFLHHLKEVLASMMAKVIVKVCNEDVSETFLYA